MSPLLTTAAHVHIQIAGPWPSVAIASLALLFTVGSFWWLNARQGRLKSYEPQSFAACRIPDKLRLLFPLVLYNSGATPIVVQDMRLTFLRNHAGRRLTLDNDAISASAIQRRLDLPCGILNRWTNRPTDVY